jgi:UDP-2,3-diacylglucosamine hydrolase
MGRAGMTAHVTGSRRHGSVCAGRGALRRRNIPAWSTTTAWIRVPKTLFISDLHLDASDPAIARQFHAFLSGEARQADALYVLGDLFEVWLGDDDPDPAARATVAALRALTDAGVPCYLMHGNRDFMIGARFCSETGATLLADGKVVDLYGERVLLMHGDLLCTDDRDYQRMRRVFRNRPLQWFFRRLPLERRRAFAQALREGSRERVGMKAPEIMDVNGVAVERAFHDNGVRTLIHGHTHRPAVHEVTVDGAPARRIVLGDWYSQGSVLEWSPAGFELRALPR